MSSGSGDAACVRFRTGVRSDPGLMRSNNEDLPLVDAPRGVYGVIDGMGGQAAGEVAAAIAREAILQRLGRPIGSPAERVREAIAIANNAIFSRAQGDPGLRGMACVITLAIVSGRVLTVGHVGDSRLYRATPAGLVKLTRDHSPVGEREDAGELSEIDAMRHPRRNEVFRDVGSAHRDKDEDGFVDVFDTGVGDDDALLLCSDGLSDMVTSAAIERVIAEHAGDPDRVAAALVDAANAAGGKDNVTVVYAEAPGFAAAVRGSGATLPAGPVRAAAAVPGAPSAPGIAGDADAAAGGASGRAPGRRERSRTAWFSAGALAGVVAVLVLAWQVGIRSPVSGRTLVVEAAGAGGGYARIGDAMAVARPGDLVRLEPGVYAERVVVRDGVDLTARIPGTATVVRPSNASGEVVGISIFGSSSSAVTGIHVTSTSELPLDVGVRIYGQGATLGQLQLSGDMRTGVEVMPSATVVMRSSQLTVSGAALAFGDDSQGTLAHNTVLRTSPAGGTPVLLAPSSQVTFRGNVFAGFGASLLDDMPAGARQLLLAGNFVIAAEPSLMR